MAAASASGKPGEEKIGGKDASLSSQQQLQQHQAMSMRYGYRQPQQQFGGPGRDDIVSADEPTKTATGVSGSSVAGSSSSSTLDSDYDEALGINYGRQSQQSRNKMTADQIINDVDSIDRYANASRTRA